MQYSQVTPPTNCIGSKYYLLIFCLNIAWKTSMGVFLSAHHAKHGLLIIIQEGAAYLGLLPLSPVLHQQNLTGHINQFLSQTELAADDSEIWGLKAPFHLSLALWMWYIISSPSLCFTMFEMGRRRLILCSHLFLQPFNQATFNGHLS